ncbi:MAG: hypothetical protein LBK55_11395 [Azoarcus sp.]|nr:hypothetical protein [Azoarcus sp.]
MQDGGPGIASGRIPRLTGRFHRIDAARSRAAGRGLSIVRHALRRRDTLLASDSALGRGACFTVAFSAHRLRAG